MIEQLIPRRKFRIQSKEFGNQWQTISYQKKASDVELEGGETVQHRIDNLVAKITELSNVIRNFKTQEGTDHDAFKRRIGLLYEQIRSGIGGVYNTFLTIEAEGEGAEDYNRLSGEFNTFQNQTRTKLTQLEADVEELLSYEPEAEGGAEKVDAYDYLDKLIDELEEYMSLVLTQVAQVIGDGDITDVLLNANVDITDQTDTSLAAALKIQHGKISGLETMMNQMGVGNPPYTWERYEYSSSDDPTTCPVKVTAMTNTGDTTTYVPVWRVVFFYQPVFKLLKMTGYMGVSGTGTLDRSVYLSMDVETNKLRFFYTLLDNYERYQWINQDENGVISTVLDQYIDPRQGLLRNGYDSTTVLRVEQWSGLTLPSYYNFNYLGISMGDTGDTAYNPSGFSVWDSGLPEKPTPEGVPGTVYPNYRAWNDLPDFKKYNALGVWQAHDADGNLNWNAPDLYSDTVQDPNHYKFCPCIKMKIIGNSFILTPNTPFITLEIREMCNGSPTGKKVIVDWNVGNGNFLEAIVDGRAFPALGNYSNHGFFNNSIAFSQYGYWDNFSSFSSSSRGYYCSGNNTENTALRYIISRAGNNFSITKTPPSQPFRGYVNGAFTTITPQSSFYFDALKLHESTYVYNSVQTEGIFSTIQRWTSTGGGSGYTNAALEDLLKYEAPSLMGYTTTDGQTIYSYQDDSDARITGGVTYTKIGYESKSTSGVDPINDPIDQIFGMSNDCYCEYKITSSDANLTIDDFLIYIGYTQFDFYY